MYDSRILNYAIQGTSPSSTWRARIHPFLSVLASAPVFSLTNPEPFIAELPPLNSYKLRVVYIILADFSDSSVILDLLIPHCKHCTLFCGSALFLPQILHYSEIVDDISEPTASFALLSGVLPFDAANWTGIYGVILPALVANTLASSLFPSQLQLLKFFCTFVLFDSRIQVLPQRTLAVATPNHDSLLLCTLLRMVLIQILTIVPFNPHLGLSAPLTVITNATCITESAQPDSMLTIPINLLILLVTHHINSDGLYRARLCSGSNFSNVGFDAFTRNITVSAFSDIQVPIFSALLTGIAVRHAFIAEPLAMSVWDTPNGLWKLERELSAHCSPRIAVPGSQKLSNRSIDAHTHTIDKVLDIGNPFQNEDMEPHHDVLLHRPLEDIPHVITAWSKESLDCYAHIALRHYSRNHRSEIRTNIMRTLLGGRIFDAVWPLGSLIAAENVCFSVRRLAIDRDGVFVNDLKIIYCINMRSTFGSAHFFSLFSAVKVTPSRDVVYRKEFCLPFVTLHPPTQISVTQHDFEVPRTVTHPFTPVEPRGVDIRSDGLKGLECIRRVSTGDDVQTNTFHIQCVKSNKNYLKSTTGVARLPKPCLLHYSNLSRSSKGLDPHAVNLMSRSTTMDTIWTFRALSEANMFGSAAPRHSGAVLDTPLLRKEHQAPEHQVIGMVSYICEGLIDGLKALSSPHHRAIVWIRNPRPTASTKSTSSCSSHRRIHDGHLAVPASIQQFLDNVRGLTALQIGSGLFQSGFVIEPFLDCSSIGLKHIIQVPDPKPVTLDDHENVVVLKDISPLGRHPMSKIHSQRHLPVSSSFTNAPSGLALQDNAPSTAASPHPEASMPFAQTPFTHISNTDFQTFSGFSQHPVRDNAHVTTFRMPIGQLANSIRGHCVDGMPLCPASAYLEQVFVSLELSGQHLRPTNDKYAVLRAIEFIRPLVYNERDPHIVIIELSFQHDSQGTFVIASKIDGTINKSIHVRGDYRIDLISRTSIKFRHILPIINRRISSVFKAKSGKPPQRFSTRTIYEVISSRIVNYSKEYQTIQSLTIDPTGVEGYASVKLPMLHGRRDRSTVHPVFIETLLHVASFVVNLQGGASDAYICNRVDSVKVIPTQVEDESTYGVYCSQWWLADQGIMLADAYAVRLANPPILVARLKGIHFRKVRLDHLKMSLVHRVGDRKRYQGARPIRSTEIPPPALPSSLPAEAPSPATSSRTTRPTSARPANDSRDALAWPVEEGSSTLMSPTTDQDIDVRQILAAVLNVCVEDIGEDDNLEELGQHASTSFVLTALKTKFGIEVPEQIFKGHPTLKKVRSYLTSCRSSQRSQSEAHIASRSAVKYQAANDDSKPKISISSTTAARLTKLLKLSDIPLPLQRSATSSLPLFLIHDGSGLISYYHGIPSLGRQVWGVNNPRFISSEPWRGVVEMASCYAHHIARVASGPVIIGGWSFGGVVAYEVSLQLAKAGINTRGILLIDSPNPFNRVPLSENLIDSIVNLDGRGTNTDLRSLVKAQFALNAGMLSHYDPQETGGPCPPLVLLRSSEGFNPPGILDIPPWLADRSDSKTATLGWGSLARDPIKVLDIPGHHFTPFKPENIKGVCERMMEACALFEAK